MPDFWKNKKILVYIALAHHTRFITPVVKKMQDQGAIVRYVVGQAERSQEITAINQRLDYSHVFDFIRPEDQPDIDKNYKRMRDTFTTQLNTSFLFNATPITVIDKTIHATAMEYIGFRNLMASEQPDLCFALHELNRWGKMFAFWAKKHNIPVLTFQEGLYYGLDYGYTGHAQYSTLNLVWGDRIRHKLIDFEAPADRIIKVGNTHLSSEMAHQKKNNIRTKKRKQLNCTNDQVILLLFSGEIPDPVHFAPLFKAIATCQGKKLFIKFHPVSKQDQVDQWACQIPEENRSNTMVFSGNENLYDLLSASDICTLVQTSTTGLEALCFGKPLIQLKVPMKNEMPYSFIELGVALQMSVESFSDLLCKNTPFHRLMKEDSIEAYLNSELSDTENAVENVVNISKKVIRASQAPRPKPLKTSIQADKDWSIIIHPAEHPGDLLTQLESVALHSEGCGSFEVIIIEPPQSKKESLEIFDSLKGNIIRLKQNAGLNYTEMMNRAAIDASGQKLILMNKSLTPMPDWLTHLENGFKKYGKQSILSSRIWGKNGNICHAGVLVDKNNSPTPAFAHLGKNFPGVLKERAFKYVDSMICIYRNFFLESGGLEKRAGDYSFLDLCLRMKDLASCIYLPEVSLISLDSYLRDSKSNAGATWFYGKWHGALWQNDDAFYKQESISKVILDTEKLTQSMLSGR